MRDALDLYARSTVGQRANNKALIREKIAPAKEADLWKQISNRGQK